MGDFVIVRRKRSVNRVGQSDNVTLTLAKINGKTQDLTLSIGHEVLKELDWDPKTQKVIFTEGTGKSLGTILVRVAKTDELRDAYALTMHKRPGASDELDRAFTRIQIGNFSTIEHVPENGMPMQVVSHRAFNGELTFKLPKWFGMRLKLEN